MEIKLFLPDHVDAVFEFEKGRLDPQWSEVQAEMHAWDQPWRKESLNHYSSLGWSFVAVDEGQRIQGYVLGQPILFFNNWTQTLWVEHLNFLEEQWGVQLMDTLIRWSKSKHLQKVLLNSQSHRANFVKESFPDFRDKGYLHLSTTKLSED